MVQKLVAVALLSACLGIAACNTVRGAAQDVQSVANCTENTINSGHCKQPDRRSRKESPAGVPGGAFLLVATRR